MTVVTRITNFAQHQQLLTNINNSEARLAVLQNQISSGQRADTYSDLGSQVSLLGALQKKIRSADQYLQSNGLIKSRLQTMGKSVSTIINLTNDLKQIIVVARSSSISEASALSQQVRSLLRNVSEQLNSNVGGRFLFGGSKTDAPPVAENIQPNVLLGIPDAGYYSGDNVTITSKISDQYDMDYGVKANDMGFQNLVAAANLTLTALSAENEDQLGQALDLANVALDGVNTVQATINNNMVTLDNTNEVLTSLKLYWKGWAEEQTNTDLIAASTQVAVDQSILQAAFQVFARISSLKLADFLR